MELPFELYKYHKRRSKYFWTKRGMIFIDDDFEEIYKKYIYATNCELCDVLFPNTRNRQLDHCHKTGKIRNIVCNKCNLQKQDNKTVGTNTGEIYITKTKSKSYKQGYCFQLRIRRDGKYILRTTRKSLEEAVELRDTFIREHPEMYS